MAVRARPARPLNPDGTSPATRMLDALGRGDVAAALLEFSPATTIRTEDRSWERHGAGGALEALEQAQVRFPDLVYEAHTRHLGVGRVIEDARVRDLEPSSVPDLDEWDEDRDRDERDGERRPGRAASAGLVLVPDLEEPTGPPSLNMPVRMTVVHDDKFVHDIVISYPRALLREALGLHVDPLDKSLSAIQSAFIAPVGSGFTTYRTEAPPPPPEVVVAPPAVVAPPVVVGVTPPRRRRLVPAALALVVLAGGAFWAVTQGPLSQDDSVVQSAVPQKKPQAKPQPKPVDSTSPSPQASGGTTSAPTVKDRKPAITLKSDLAFGRDSATLSAAAKKAIDGVARTVRTAGLKGTIRINGYTDDLGSAQHGLELSQKRASAVASYLRSQLDGVEIPIVALGHGEADPIASNATEAGRLQNRRVTIDLPRR